MSNSGLGLSKKGYMPKAGERTPEGFVKNNVSLQKEVSLYTKSSNFSNNPRGVGGFF